MSHADRRDFLRQLTLATAAVGAGAAFTPLSAETLDRTANDDLWNRYAIGDERNVNDPLTKQPARRNPFAKATPGEPSWSTEAKLDTLRARGAIFLVCNRASMNWAAGAAERTKTDVDKVREEVRNGLVPGATLMPTGVFALVRAQNAGCAYMRGS